MYPGRSPLSAAAFSESLHSKQVATMYIFVDAWSYSKSVASDRLVPRALK